MIRLWLLKGRLQTSMYWIVASMSRLSPGVSNAEIRPDPANRDPSVAQDVNAAVVAWEVTTDCRDNQLFHHLLTVAQTSHWIIIVKDYDGDSVTVRDDPGPDRNAEDPALGAPSIVYWNRNQRLRVRGVPPALDDPTAFLIHELAHAARNAEGTHLDNTWGPEWSPAPPSEQLGGTYIENMYRRAQNLTMRTNYGKYTLSPG